MSFWLHGGGGGLAEPLWAQIDISCTAKVGLKNVLRTNSRFQSGVEWISVFK